MKQKLAAFQLFCLNLAEFAFRFGQFDQRLYGYPALLGISSILIKIFKVKKHGVDVSIRTWEYMVNNCPSLLLWSPKWRSLTNLPLDMLVFYLLPMPGFGARMWGQPRLVLGATQAVDCSADRLLLLLTLPGFCFVEAPRRLCRAPIKT